MTVDKPLCGCTAVCRKSITLGNDKLRLNHRIPGRAICILLNKYSNYCYTLRSSKHTDTCKWLGWVFCNHSHEAYMESKNLLYIFALKGQLGEIRRLESCCIFNKFILLWGFSTWSINYNVIPVQRLLIGHCQGSQ